VRGGCVRTRASWSGRPTCGSTDTTWLSSGQDLKLTYLNFDPGPLIESGALVSQQRSSLTASGRPRVPAASPPSPLPRVLGAVTAAALALGLSACGGTATAEDSDDRPVVLTTFTVLADTAENVDA